MASSKKGKKNKGKTFALIDFLQETPGTLPTLPIRKSTLNWADEVDDVHDIYDPRSTKSVVLPTAPKASRDFDDISDKIPQQPPFIAYLSNLPYDVDENEISFFFQNMKISNMKIPKDERPGELPKLKGYGYVEFEDRESLIQALVIPDTTIKNRRIRIEVASDYDNDKRRSGGRSDQMSRDRNNRSSSDMASMGGDWRSGPRAENPISESNTDRRGFSRDKDREDNYSGAWRDSNNDRRSNRDTSERVFTRNTDKSRDDQEFRPIERKFDNSDRGGNITRSNIMKEDTEKGTAESRRRPKLVLAPRTKPIESVPADNKASGSIFGNAKPVDTSARERQIEERLAKANEKPVRELSRERKIVVGKEKEQDESKNDVSEKKNDKNSSHNSDLNGVSEKAEKIHPKKNEDNSNDKKNDKDVEKINVEKGKREEKREKPEKEMPKLKKLDPPNFIANNKFAFLENEDNSD